jgi:hypothetical protein
MNVLEQPVASIFGMEMEVMLYWDTSYHLSASIITKKIIILIFTTVKISNLIIQ